MKSKSYTFLVASSSEGTLRKLRVPFYVVHLLAIFAIVGGITVFAAMTSYSRMLWKVANYNALRNEQASLKKQFTQLQAVVKDTNQRLSSLQSLATEVAMTYGIMRFRETPFGLAETTLGGEADYERSLEQFRFLRKNATAIALASQGLRLMPGRSLDSLTYTPSLWPVLGSVTGNFGDRLDPFSGEGAFHAGVDISAAYGTEVRAAADGIVVTVEMRAGYGRVVIIDHGFGTTTWYGHLSGFRAREGATVKRGEVIGYVGTSGRASGPHVHYEVRFYGAPVNPWRFLSSGNSAD
ncbi:MAG TPA: M23 family metallopeptidase [Candidatus Nitrosotenuis sp.]|nr:M23 family metallopeptidase [Candidatus Nitrosotenuis sp.]